MATQKDFTGGMISDANVSLLPENSVSLAVNFDFDVEIGSAVTRPGTEGVGSQLVAGKSILGLAQHIDNADASHNKLFATINVSNDGTSVIYDVLAGTTSVTGLTASKKMRFLNFNNALLAINGADGERSYTSAGWITTGGAFDLANFPGSDKCNLCASFLSRVYAAGDTANPSRVYYSGVSTGGAVSWTVGNGYVDIDVNDGAGPITAFGKVPGYLLFFKERSMTRWNFSSAFPESLIQIGTPSQESVVMGGGLCAFYSASNESAKGFYITSGDRPICISQDNSRPIKKWVDAIPTDANVCGWATDRGFAWSIGSVTVDGESYSNVVLKYNRLLNNWAVRTYPTQFKVFAPYLVSGVNTIVAGNDNGTIIRIDKVGAVTDAPNATAIPWKLRQQHQTFGVNTLKSITDKVVVRGRNIEGAVARAIVDEQFDKPVDINAGKPLAKRILKLFGITNTIKGTTVAVEVSGETAGSHAYIREIELPTVAADQNYA
jgi:hypothetical protein